MIENELVLEYFETNTWNILEDVGENPQLLCQGVELKQPQGRFESNKFIISMKINQKLPKHHNLCDEKSEL